MSTRSLLIDTRLYMAEGLGRRNLMSNRDVFDSASGSFTEQVVALNASMSQSLGLDLLAVNTVTVLRSSTPIEVTVTLLVGGSFTATVASLFVLSSPITALSVRNLGTKATDLIFAQI